jgi:FliI/YscN family ATPase
VRVELGSGRIGDLLQIKRRGAPLLAEIVGFDAGEVVAMPYGDLAGVGPNDVVEAHERPLEIAVGPELLGRVLDGLGQPLDSGAALPQTMARAVVDATPPKALERRAVDRVLATGLRALDGFVTLGVGQRLGLFSAAGVGKSTVLAELCKNAEADVVVAALVGERGREVGDFLQHALGGGGRERAVVVAATSDAPAIVRLKAAETAMTIAEHFRDQGKSVLLLLDSLTRVARAQREVGLATGEPPARRGYPPSVFARLPRLLERAGPGKVGAITALFAVLVEGDDLDEPVADEVRGIVDGHLVLSRRLAERGHFPAIDVVASMSRLLPRLLSRQECVAVETVRRWVAAFEEKRDLIALGAYAKGSDTPVDKAIVTKKALEAFLRQPPGEKTDYAETRRRLLELSNSA